MYLEMFMADGSEKVCRVCYLHFYFDFAIELPIGTTVHFFFLNTHLNNIFIHFLKNKVKLCTNIKKNKNNVKKNTSNYNEFVSIN
jgi:hypothetical protein